ncbi:MAG: MFS transporter, partial [Deltaproteobacteria bacterium]|nr:MFS transporter [Deltaproteobacteria bacterium]
RKVEGQDKGARKKGSGTRLNMDRKRIAAWVLYDFANSVYPAVITGTVFSVYYATKIVGNEKGEGDLWWGRVISVSMLFAAITSPVLGSIADRTGIRKRLLFFYTYLCVISVALFTVLEPGMVITGFLLALTANIGFESALVYYNAYLPEIAPREKRGYVSGIGYGAGYAGSITGLVVALILVYAGQFELIWLFTALFFALVSIPVFVVLPEKQGSAVLSTFGAIGNGLKGFRRLFRDVSDLRELRRFLLAYFVYIDGVNTIAYFAAIFAATTLGFSPRGLIYLFLAVQVSALAGSLAMARPTDLWGPKKVIFAALFLMAVVVVSVYFAYSKTVFFSLAVFAGLGLGAVQSASRSLMSLLIPRGRETEMFGFYAFCGKSSSIIGPFVFGAVSHALAGDQRTALLTVVVFFVAGVILLRRVAPVAADSLH